MKELSAIELSNISFSYGEEQILAGINCKIGKGTYVGLVGHNGSGKTTLLKIILGLLKPKTGTVYLFGKRLEEFSAWEKIGYVSQYSALRLNQIPIRVDEVVGMETDEPERIDEALRTVDMLSHKHHLMGELSGGQQQRVFIARAIAKKPELLILDEPTVGVDVRTQEKFYRLLDQLNKEDGITLLLVSHDLHTISHKVRTVVQLDRKAFSYQTTTCEVVHTHE